MTEPKNDTLTPEDMQQWLEQELRDLTKALELRVQDATELVTAYAVGKLTPREATARFLRYSARWGDAILGVRVESGLTNDEILRRLDEKNLPDRGTRLARRFQAPKLGGPAGGAMR